VDDFSSDTFVYDIIQNDQLGESSDLFIQLEDIFGGTYPGVGKVDKI